MSEENDQTPILVMTEHDGVFAGLFDGDPTADHKDQITVTEARICVYWASDMNGVLGLAQMGPSEECRISPAVEKLTIYDITAIAEITPEAWKRWKEEPWN